VSNSSRPSLARRLAALLGVVLLAQAAWAAAAEVGEFRGLAVEDPIARRVLEQPTLVRELPPIAFAGSRRITEWLLDHPPLAATLARRLHPPLEQYLVTPAPGGQYWVDDQNALRGLFGLVAAGGDRRLYRGVGRFGAPGRLLHASGALVIFLHYRERPRPVDGPQIEIAPALHVRLENLFVRGVARLLAPLLHGVIDRRVANLSTAARIVSRQILEEPRALYARMEGWPELRPVDLEAYRRAFLSGEAVP